MFALVDCNNFYASCERAFNPRLAGRPVVVLSNNDGCVIARSNEAKALNIAMGAPYHEVEKLCRKERVAVFSSNYELYGDMSRRVMRVLRGWASRIEVYSIDEAFLDVTDIPFPQLESELAALRERVRKWTGIPVSIGVGRTKTLAKVVNRKAKKSTGLGLATDEEAETDLLNDLPVEDLWGIGRRLRRHLEGIDITTARQLRDADARNIRRRFNVVVERTVLELRGISCLGLEDLSPPRKSLMMSRSFGTKVTAYRELEAAVATFASRAAEKLRQGGQVAEALEVFAHTSRFDKSARPYAALRKVALRHPTADTRLIVSAALEGLADLYVPGPRYAKAGVLLLGLGSAAMASPSLFAGVDTRQDKSLMRTIDHLNHRYGRDTIQVAAAQSGRRWHMRRERKSPAFTTRWEDLPRAG